MVGSTKEEKMTDVLVRRDGEGEIDGVSGVTLHPDPGYTERLPEDDPEVMAFEAGPPEPPSPAEIIEAMDGIEKGDRTKLDALMVKIS